MSGPLPRSLSCWQSLAGHRFHPYVTLQEESHQGGDGDARMRGMGGAAEERSVGSEHQKDGELAAFGEVVEFFDEIAAAMSVEAVGRNLVEAALSFDDTGVRVPFKIVVALLHRGVDLVESHLASFELNNGDGIASGQLPVVKSGEGSGEP